MCITLLLALLWETKFSWKFVRQLFVTNLIAGIITAVVFITINHGIGFLRYDLAFTSGDSLLRRFGVAIVSLIGVFGPLGIIVIFMFSIDLARKALLHGKVSWWGRLFLIAGPIFLVRFITLPTKFEYVLPAIILLLLAIAYEQLATAKVAVVSLSLIVPSILSISLFKRTDTADNLVFSISLDRGAVSQDWQLTSYNKLVTSPQFLDRVADIF